MFVTVLQVFAAEFAELTGHKAARLFFVLNYIMGVVCILNLLNTYIISNFWNQFAGKQER
jgi:hypothetical protein